MRYRHNLETLKKPCSRACQFENAWGASWVGPILPTTGVSGIRFTLAHNLLHDIAGHSYAESTTIQPRSGPAFANKNVVNTFGSAIIARQIGGCRNRILLGVIQRCEV